MAVAERASQAERVQSPAAAQSELRSPIARLAALHAEAQDTARLANLLGRTIHAAGALVAMGAAGLAFSGVLSLENVVWSGFVLAGAGAIALAWRRTMKRPFERAALRSFSQDLDAIMAFAGTAWGAGAFLALPVGASLPAVLLFSAGACAALALLLREHEPALHFLAPAAALTSFACVLRPLPGGALCASLVLTACAAVAAASVITGRWHARMQNAPELPSLPYA